ncbi:MAG TPA: hypothetical protein VEX64_00690, partial [Pyrinomonadaceae bacterium]|nr:hypothetical protein [Pyrinomonadaceae bacterium]
ALALAAIAWTVLLFLAWFDRITFDGDSLRRTGLLPRLWSRIFRRPLRIRLSEIEQIETQALRALQTGGRVYYRYRSEIRGNDLIFSFASGGGAAFRRMVRRLFPLVPEDKLDARSLELCNYLADPKETQASARLLQLPSDEVAENSLKKPVVNDKMRQIKRNLLQDENHQVESAQHVKQLRQVANELRLAGNFPQSLEAFRRALFVAPTDGWLLLEFSRTLHSYASSCRRMKLMRRAFAVLRLAARRGSDNAKLLARIGESYFQYGEQKRAELVFRRVLELDADNFRASCGLAEIALHEGKLAHVIHHYQAATRAAEDEALKLWARTEADYFALLNRNEDYMDAELTRINWLHNVENGSRICLRLAISGLFVVSFGVFFDDLLAQLGLALTAGTTLFWVVLTIIGKFLISRSDVVEEENNE